MNIAYHGAFPAGYLLVLAPGAGPAAAAGLAHHLDRACRSRKPAVWVDCRLLDALSATAARLLWACHRRLRRHRGRLVFCNVSARTEQALRRIFAGADLCVVPTLDDAAQAGPPAGPDSGFGPAG